MTPSVQAERPNVIVIMSDDQGGGERQMAEFGDHDPPPAFGAAPGGISPSFQWPCAFSASATSLGM